MGHVANPEREYRLLQQRYDRTVTGAPYSPTFIKILKLLFSPEEAELARQVPGRPTSLGKLSRKLDMPEEELEDTLTELAQRGVVLDLEHQGKRYYMLPPVVVGFFEFTLMRARDNFPTAELSRLFTEYMDEDDRFAYSLFQGETQVGRSLVREEALPEGDHTEILDWERSSALIKSASALSVGLCPCRHKAGHMGTACDAPVRVCLSLNAGADAMIRNGISDPITTGEAMDILETCKEAGLAQTGDNVQRDVSFLCNCCKCCCGLIKGIRSFGIPHAIVSSNWIMAGDAAQCTGCGACVKACPVDAINVVEQTAGDPKSKRAVLDESICMGCGVCYSACKSGAISMKSRPQRVLTPETVFDRVVRMAIERGKLADLLFEAPERLTHRALGRVLSVLEKSPPWKAAMAVKPLRSAFLNAMLKGVAKG